MAKIYLLCSILLVLVTQMILFAVKEYHGCIPSLPEHVQNITQFNNLSMFTSYNDLSMFTSYNDMPRMFKFHDDSSTDEAYLRFAIPDFDPTPYRLILRIKAPPELLKVAKVRSARDLKKGGVIHGDIATFDISMKDPTPFLWSDGKCYVGIAFPRSALRDGDVVELVDFKFELAK